jgi:putative DNA primase/helicase
MADNIYKIIGRLEALGFEGVTESKLLSKRYARFRVQGYKQPDAGSVSVKEIILKNGRRVLVGNIYIYDGPGYVYHEKIDLSDDKDKYGSTREERRAIAKQIKEKQAKTEAAERAKANKAALLAERKYHACKPADPSTALYLSDKRVDAFDVRMTSDGAVVVPIRVAGRIAALQFLLSKNIPSHAEKIRKIGGNKRIWPAGCKIKGGCHWIGGLPRPGDVVVIAEGFATAATIRQTTGLICVVAFSAGNIKPVVDALLEKYPDVYLLIAADDDDLKQCPNEECRHRFILSQQDDPFNCPECKQPHGRNNAGRDAAMKACTDSRVNHLLPMWADKARRLHEWLKHGNKRTDFNDLMIGEGEGSVRLIFERYINDLRLKLPSHAERVATLPAQDDGKKKYIVEDLPTALWRFVLIADGGDSVYDMLLRKVIKMSDARNQIHNRDLYRRWQEATEPDKRVITLDDIGLYFGEKDKDRPGNMWRGFATQPVQDDDLAKELKDFVRDVVCGGNEVYLKFLMSCLAYSVQRLGDRPKVGIILNSDEGYGKGTFARLALRIWGEYGIVFDQEALEDRFNAQKENKCITIFEEIGAASGMDRHKLKNLMKHAVDGDTQRINPKQVNARNVKNYAVSFFPYERASGVPFGKSRPPLVRFKVKNQKR